MAIPNGFSFHFFADRTENRKRFNEENSIFG